jgi:hypothetical protein
VSEAEEDAFKLAEHFQLAQDDFQDIVVEAIEDCERLWS